MDPRHLLWGSDITVTRLDGAWRFTRHVTEPTGVFSDDFDMTDAEVLAKGPPSLPSSELETIAHALGKAPLDMPWYRERLLGERIVGDDVDGMRALLSKATSEHLTLAIEAKAWNVAIDLVTQGTKLVAPHKEWTPGDFLISRLDDRGLRLLDLIKLKPLNGLLRLAKTPGVARKLIELGASLEAAGPAGKLGLDGALEVGTPLMIAVQLQRFDVAEALLEAGANREGRDKHGRTALEFIRWMGRPDSIAWLEARTRR